MRGRVIARPGAFWLVSLVILLIPVAAASSPDLELQTSWGRVDLALGAEDGGAVGLQPVGLNLAAQRPERLTDVKHILAFKPHIIERAPYVPGTPIGDHVATALIVTGGAAILTSIIADWASH